jgi:hypothetical protein
MCTCPALGPRRDRPALAIYGPVGVAFRNSDRVGSLCDWYFGAESHSLRTRCLRFAAFLPLGCTATQDSLPAAGQTLPGGVGYPLGSNTRFQSFGGSLGISSSSSRLCLAQQNLPANFRSIPISRVKRDTYKRTMSKLTHQYSGTAYIELSWEVNMLYRNVGAPMGDWGTNSSLDDCHDMGQIHAAWVSGP